VRDRRPSLTARWVAAQRANLAPQRPTLPTGDAAAERRLYDSLGRFLRLSPFRPTAMVQRTGFVDDDIVAAIESGTSQVVIVGAGYDGRPLRFNSPGVHWIEVDHPATQPDKRRRLAALGVPLDHVTFCAVDLLRGDLDAALDGAGHQQDQSTLWICEGLVSYLPTQATTDLCRTLHGRSSPGSVLVTTFLIRSDAPPRTRILRSLVDLLLLTIGERRRALFRPGDPEDLLAAAGWSVVRSLASAGGGDRGLALAAEPRPTPARNPSGSTPGRDRTAPPT
jgi:methyltransferase (TIGR00027 family)